MLLLIRHGSTALNNPAHERIRGWLDVPLSAHGAQDAAAAAQQARKFPLAHIYASDLQRAAKTAETVSEAMGVPMSTHPQLRPWNLGDLNGTTVKTAMPVIFHLVDHPTEPAPHGETFDAFKTRFLSFAWPLLRHAGLFGMVTHIRNIKTLEAIIAGKGEIDRTVFDAVPAVDPGGLVLASEGFFAPLTRLDRAQAGAGS